MLHGVTSNRLKGAAMPNSKEESSVSKIFSSKTVFFCKATFWIRRFFTNLYIGVVPFLLKGTGTVPYPLLPEGTFEVDDFPELPVPSAKVGYVIVSSGFSISFLLEDWLPVERTFEKTSIVFFCFKVSVHWRGLVSFVTWSYFTQEKTKARQEKERKYLVG